MMELVLKGKQPQQIVLQERIGLTHFANQEIDTIACSFHLLVRSLQERTISVVLFHLQKIGKQEQFVHVAKIMPVVKTLQLSVKNVSNQPIIS
ncbi:hypothetical protein Trydic_g8830 [Trypoxylus dichotomus]